MKRRGKRKRKSESKRLTRKDAESAHSRKGVSAASVQNVELVVIAANSIDFPVEVLNGRYVAIVELVQNEAFHHASFAHSGRAKHQHANAIGQRRVLRLVQQRHADKHFDLRD